MKYTGIHNLKQGDYYEKDFYIEESMGEKFAELSGDYNPVHLNKEYAEKTIFKGQIAHGMLVASFISGVIGNDFPGEGTIYMKQDLQFLKPVRYGDTIKVRIEADVIYLEKSRVSFRTECYNQKEEKVIAGTALVMVNH